MNEVGLYNHQTTYQQFLNVVFNLLESIKNLDPVSDYEFDTTLRLIVAIGFFTCSFLIFNKFRERKKLLTPEARIASRRKNNKFEKLDKEKVVEERINEIIEHFKRRIKDSYKETRINKNN